MIIILVGLIIINLPEEKSEPKTSQETKETEEIKGVFISYIDYGHLKNKTKEMIVIR